MYEKNKYPFMKVTTLQIVNKLSEIPFLKILLIFSIKKLKKFIKEEGI